MARPVITAQSLLGGDVLDRAYTLFSDSTRDFTKGCMRDKYPEPPGHRTALIAAAEASIRQRQVDRIHELLGVTLPDAVAAEVAAKAAGSSKQHKTKQKVCVCA